MTSTTKADLFPYLLQNHPCPMWIFDHATLQFLEVNTAAVTSYGYTRSEFLKMKITQIRPKDQIPKLLAEIRPFRLEGTQVSEWQHLTKDRRLLDVEIISSQFYFQDRAAVFIEVHDITQRKEEHALRMRRAMSDVLTRSFTSIREQLEEAQSVLSTNPAEAYRCIQYAQCLAQQSLIRSRQLLWNSSFSHKEGNSFRLKRGELTLREKEVLQLLTEGKSNKQIAALLEVTEGTIKLHVNHILRKLGTTARTEAVIHAIKRGLVSI